MTKRETSGEIKELERGRRYSIRVRLAPDAEHKNWHWSKSRKVFGNKAAAIVALDAYKQELQDIADGTATTLKEFIQAWEKDREDTGKISSLTLQRDRVETRRLIECLGDVRLKDLDRKRIEQAYQLMRREKGLSDHAMNKINCKLRQILRAACKEGLIDRNPTEYIDDCPRPRVSREKRDLKRITEEDAKRFAKELKADELTGWTMAIWIALVTGARRGECLALTWDDIDLERNKISINKQLGKEMKLKPPKTEAAFRVLTIGTVTVERLRSWKRKQKEEFFSMGIPQTGSSPVCSNSLGAFTDPDNFSRWRRKYFIDHGLGGYKETKEWIDSRGIPRIKHSGYVGPDFHSLRHTQASILIAEGVDIKVAQERLGHSDVHTTMQLYAAAEDPREIAAGEMVDGLFE